ncbi:MAG TPA: hypothetical protein VF736_00490 [Pyrinomonadaceae bacterium]|jgi:predicted small secreted protein
MRRRLVCALLSLAVSAPLAGCGWLRGAGSGGIGAAGGGVGIGGGEAGAEELAAALSDFTRELTGRVEAASDPKEGVADAQRLLDSRGAELAARVEAFKKGPRARSQSERAKWLEAEVDNAQRLRELQLKYLDASMRDPALKAGLERLVSDYDSMLRDR